MPTLSLCMIVGKNEAVELERLLKSVQGDLFDEIIVTTTWDDPEVKAIAEKYADMVPHFEWVNNFSEARNFSFSQSSSSHIMWLDADDVLTKENYDKLVALKSSIDSYDTIMLEYNYSHDKDGKATVVLPRERIVRNCDEIKWIGAVHECLTIQGRTVRRSDIAVDHWRTREYDPDRNITISKKVYESGKASPREKFYYGKDLIEAGRTQEAVPVLVEYLGGPTDFNDNKVIACLRLARFHLDKGNRSKQVEFLRKATTYSESFAEVYFYLGEYYEVQKDVPKAIELYETAFSKEMTAGMSMESTFYDKLPAEKLSQLYYGIGELEKSLRYCNELLKITPGDERLLGNRKVIQRDIEASKKPSNVEATKKELDRSAIVPFEGDMSIGWMIPFVNPIDPAQRIRRLSVHNYFKNSESVKSELYNGYYSADPEWVVGKLSAHKAVIFTQFSAFDLNLITRLKARGVRVVVDLCEAIFDNELVVRILKEAHLVVCCSSKLAEMAAPYARTAVVEDAIEEVQPDEAHRYRKPGKPVAMFMGMGGNSFLVTDHLRDTIEESGFELKVVSEWDGADIKWDINTWPDVLNTADVVLCPQREDVQPAKSNVKVTAAMALGIPVIASPIQSYQEVITNGLNGFLCETANKGQWAQALSILSSENRRIQFGLNGQGTVDRFRMPVIANKLESILRKMIAVRSEEDRLGIVEEDKESSANDPREPIALVIPNYNNVEYLKMCITSIKLNTLHPYEIVISDGGSDKETWDYLNTLQGIKIVGSPDTRRCFSETCNEGIKASVGKYFAILNSDIILSKGWLTNIVKKMDNIDRLAACGVLSNCDRGWLHGVPGKPSFPMKLDKANLELVPAMKKEQIDPNMDELYNFMDKSNRDLEGKFLHQEWVAAYATVFARSVVSEVGLFDTEFKNGCEDLDLCRRIKAFGYDIGQALDSYVFHFGGISRGAYQDEDKEEYDKEDRYNHEIYRKKWEKKNVAIYTGPAWEPWDRNTVDSGMAGSETWAAEIAAEFSKKGFNAVIYNECPEDGYVDRDGVTYRHYSKMQEDIQYKFIDLCILSRTCEPLNFPLRTSNVYVMVHDIWLHHDKGYDVKQGRVVKYACLSEWHKEFFSDHHSVPEDKIMLTSNGVNTKLYEDVGSYEKKNQIFYSSSPDRGLEQLLEMFPLIKKEVPDLVLKVAYGFHNWESAAKQRNNPEEVKLIEKIKGLMEQDGVEYLGRVDKEELSVVQKESKAWLYPTWFSETFCITGVEAGMSENAIVTTPYAGILTTLGDSPSYIRGNESLPISHHSRTPEYQEAFVKESIKILTDDEYRKGKASDIKEQVSKYTWEHAYESWVNDWLK